MKQSQKWLLASAIFQAVIGIYLWQSGTKIGLILLSSSIVMLAAGFSMSDDEKK